jgi:hypothetical protein
MIIDNAVDYRGAQLNLKIFIVKKEVKIKLPLYQAMEDNRVVRRRGSHTF